MNRIGQDRVGRARARLHSPFRRSRRGLGPGKLQGPGPCRTYPTPSGFTQHLQNLSNTFRIYPTPSGFTQHLQDLPNPSGFTQQLQNLPNIFRMYPTFSEFTQHLHNLPNTFRIYPTPSEFTHHLQNSPTTFRIHSPTFRKNRFWAVGPFCTFFDLFADPKNVRFDKNEFLVRSIN